MKRNSIFEPDRGSKIVMSILFLVILSIFIYGATNIYSLNLSSFNDLFTLLFILLGLPLLLKILSAYLYVKIKLDSKTRSLIFATIVKKIVIPVSSINTWQVISQSYRGGGGYIGGYSPFPTYHLILHLKNGITFTYPLFFKPPFLNTSNALENFIGQSPLPFRRYGTQEKKPINFPWQLKI